MSEASTGGAPSSFADAINTGDDGGQQSGPPSSLKAALARGDSSSFDPIHRRSDTPDREDQQPRETRRQSSDDLDMDREVTVKVNGQEKRVKLRDAIDFYQRGDSANKRFQEASALKKQADERASKAESMLRNKDALLAHLLNDADGVKTVHETYQEMMRLSKLSPEEQQEFLRVRDLEARDAQLKELESAKEAERAEERENAQIDQHLDGMEDAYERIGWWPAEGPAEDIAELIMVDMLERVQEEGLKGITYRHVASTIKEAMTEMSRGWLSSASDEELAEAIGEKRLQALLGNQVRGVTSRLPQSVPRQGPPQQAPRGRDGKFSNTPVVHHSGDLRTFSRMLDGPPRR